MAATDCPGRCEMDTDASCDVKRLSVEVVIACEVASNAARARWFTVGSSTKRE